MDPTIYAPLDPSLPPVLDLAVCRKLIDSARGAHRMPHGELFLQMSVQLKLLLDERNTFADKISGAQGDAVRYQREAQTANVEIGTLRSELLETRKRLDEARGPAVAAPILSDPGSPVVKRKGRRGKVVEMNPQQKAAQ